jgi:hypothetical protein
MDQLHEIGLYLNDLNKFDGSAEMLVTELQHGDQLQKAFDAVNSYLNNKFWQFIKMCLICSQKQRSLFEQLASHRVELNAWKRKGKKLLYSMLPAKIARQIENGVEPNTICEVQTDNFYLFEVIFYSFFFFDP